MPSTVSFVAWIVFALPVMIVAVWILYAKKKAKREVEDFEYKADSYLPVTPGSNHQEWEPALADLDRVTLTVSDEGKEFKILQMEEDEVKYYVSRMKRWVVGQDDVLVRLAHIMYRRRHFPRENRPLATLLFVGPRGVGKTATAKAMGDAFFGSPRFAYVLDMTDPFYLDLPLKESVERIISTQLNGVLVFEGIERKPKELLEVLAPHYGGGSKRLNRWMVVLATSALHDFYLKEIRPQEESISQESAARKMKEILFSRNLMLDEMDLYIDKTLLLSSLEEKAFWALGVRHLKEVSRFYNLPLLGVTPDALAHLVKVSKNGSSGARTILGYIHSVILDRLLLLNDQKVWLDAEDGRFVLRSGYGKELKESLLIAKEKSPSQE